MIRELGNSIPHAQLADPLPRYAGLAIERTGDLATDGSGRTRIVTQVDCLQDCIAKRVGLMEAPQGGFQAVDHLAATSDFVLGLVPVFASGEATEASTESVACVDIHVMNVAEDEGVVLSCVRNAVFVDTCRWVFTHCRKCSNPPVNKPERSR